MVRRMLFVFVLLAGCEMVEDEGTTEAIALCDQATVGICNKVASCSATISPGDCTAALRRELNCQRAVGVSSSYQRCLSEVGGSTCQGLTDPSGGLALPASCSGIILVR